MFTNKKLIWGGGGVLLLAGAAWLLFAGDPPAGAARRVAPVSQAQPAPRPQAPAPAPRVAADPVDEPVARTGPEPTQKRRHAKRQPRERKNHEATPDTEQRRVNAKLF